MGIVFYSLALQQTTELDHLFQLQHSLASLRAQNSEIPVYLFVTGEPQPLMAHFLARQFAVHTIHCGNYASLLDAVSPGASLALADYPILHKFLCLAGLVELKPRQALYVDNDTLFFADPARLLADCQEADIYAREEPGSFGSLHGYLPEHLDEERWVALAAAEGSCYVRPFNTGVMVLNHAIWERFLELAPDFLGYVLRFTQATAPTARPSGLPPYPAGSLWIRDQVAFWLVLGQIPAFRLGLFEPSQVLVGCEEMRAPGVFPRPILTHYFSFNALNFFEHLTRNPYASGESVANL